MTTIQHKDSIGQILSPGDFVTFPHEEYQSLRFGKVTRFTAKMVGVDIIGFRNETLKVPDGLLKVEGPVIEAFFAERGMV